MLNAHMAFDSDCFSHAIASTRRYLPDCTRLVATTPVDPPTEPAVCTRISGLPVAPTASAMNSSGIMTPSKKSGALPTTTASMSSIVDPESANALSMASRTRPFIETSWRFATYFVWPVPSTAASWPAILFPFQDGNEILLQHRAAGRVREHPSRGAVENMLCRKADALQPCGEHRVGGQCAARRVDLRRRRQADGLGQEELLMAERRVDFGHLDRGGVPAGRCLCLSRRRRRRGQVAVAEHRSLDPVLDACDPRRVLPKLAGLFAGGQHDRRG